jgi:hypothetical protein
MADKNSVVPVSGADRSASTAPQVVPKLTAREALWRQFRIGVKNYVDDLEGAFLPKRLNGQGPMICADKREFWKRCRQTFDRLIERGEGECFITRRGRVIKDVTSFASIVAKDAMSESYFLKSGSFNFQMCFAGKQGYTE